MIKDDFHAVFIFLCLQSENGDIIHKKKNKNYRRRTSHVFLIYNVLKPRKDLLLEQNKHGHVIQRSKKPKVRAFW